MQTSAIELASISPKDIFGRWLERFRSGLAERNPRAVADLIGPEGSWKDFLAISWDYVSYLNPVEIEGAAQKAIAMILPASIKPASGRREPQALRRSGRELIEAFFDFETNLGRGTGFVRLLRQDERPQQPQAWQLVTTLQELKGSEERVGDRRPTGDEFAKNAAAGNWLDWRREEEAYDDRHPDVLIVGAGHSGLALAARLRHMGVDALLIERHKRVGDTWRQRYHSLTLHNQITANHLPYMPFPPGWHNWLPKDKLAGWLESYAEAMELNVWTDTRLLDANFDENTKTWRVKIDSGERGRAHLSCKHLVFATGVSGSIPKTPYLDGIEDFGGEVLHSSQFVSGSRFARKRALVVGTGNSGHDIAQDLHINGASVTMLQRSPTCVVSLDPVAMLTYAVYSGETTAEDVDIQTLAIPYPALKETYQWFTKKARRLDEDLLKSLNSRGFETYYGDDDTGFHMMYLRGEGGYYINVGCSDLISEGKVGVIQTRDADRFVAQGLRMADGEVEPFDVVVLATGFANMQENLRAVLGDDVADRVGPVWGFDENYAMRNMWRPTAQEGLWIMGGGLIDARLFSRFLAIQIAAALRGLSPRLALPAQGGLAGLQAA